MQLHSICSTLSGETTKYNFGTCLNNREVTIRIGSYGSYCVHCVHTLWGTVFPGIMGVAIDKQARSARRRQNVRRYCVHPLFGEFETDNQQLLSDIRIVRLHLVPPIVIQ